MKPCEVCGKKDNGQLATQLMQGPNGYRRYQACPKCRSKAILGKNKPAKKPTQPNPGR